MIKFKSTTSKVHGTELYLEVFRESKLIKTSLIPLSLLEQTFKYNVPTVNLKMFYFDSEDKWNQRDNSFDLATLLEECVEVQEFAKEYFPQYSI